MPMILLTGAGFSRNWGGWLAKEVFEYLIGDDRLTPSLRALLWEKREEGFEAALNKLQLSGDPADADDLLLLTTSLADMFEAMNDAFRPNSRQVVPWLAGFDSIFTLNQDTLVERLWDAVILGTPRPLWLPGTKSEAPWQLGPNWWRDQLFADPETIGMPVNSKSVLPYFKLHGSSRLADPTGALPQMLIVGGRKAEAIERSPLLSWYFDEFASRLQAPGARLVIVGYGFRDDHVNKVIVEAVRQGLQLFIIDPAGYEVLTVELTEAFRDALAGASRRPVISIFGGDKVELRKYKRFERDAHTTQLIKRD